MMILNSGLLFWGHPVYKVNASYVFRKVFCV